VRAHIVPAFVDFEIGEAPLLPFLASICFLVALHRRLSTSSHLGYLIIRNPIL